ncbi:Protein of unknown function DUF4817 [Trinorchestia longiramus]|nr:Protein of unknown function DUF4817 [Trinorchestia longiramus]
MQLTNEQRVFVVTTWISTRSIKRVQALFAQHFTGRRLPCKDTIWKNTNKYQQEGTSRNLNKGCSGRKRTARSEEHVKNVQNLLLQTLRVLVERNGLPLTKSSFNRIVVCDLHLYPYKIQVRYQLLETNFPSRRLFAEWLLNKHARFMEKFVIGDKVAFFMNGKVNTQNVRFYARKHDAPEFNFGVNICQAKISLWIRLCGNGSLVGPVFYDNNLNGLMYLNMINKNSPRIVAHLLQTVR